MLVNTKHVYKYFLPAFIALSSSAMLTNTDIVLVKHFFSPDQAGIYSVAQMIGKIILFLPTAITMVMFPKLSENFTRNEKTTPMLKKCLLFTAGICFSASAIFILFPQFFLKLLAGRVPEGCLVLIAPFAISMSFFALNNVFLFYYLSAHNSRVVFLFLICAFAQIGLIFIFNNSLVQVLYVLIGCAVTLFIINLLNMQRKVKEEECAAENCT